MTFFIIAPNKYSYLLLINFLLITIYGSSMQ